MVFLRKNNDFQGFGLQNIHPKSMSIRIRKIIEKNSPKIDFGVDFGLPKPLEIAVKSTRGAKKEDLERSLFRDAMETVSKSSQINGSRRL